MEYDSSPFSVGLSSFSFLAIASFSLSFLSPPRRSSCRYCPLRRVAPSVRQLSVLLGIYVDGPDISAHAVGRIFY